MTRPLAAQVAFGLVMAAAAASALLGLSPLLQIGTNVAAAQRRDPGAPHEAVASAVIGITAALVAVAVVFAVALLVFGLRFRGGRPRARIVLVVLSVLSLAPLSASALLVTAVLVVADVLMFRPSVTAWLRGDG